MSAALAAARRRMPEAGWVAVLLALHAALAIWGAARNSVTYDENFHLPAGVATVTRGDLWTSPVNPPLVKDLCGVAALAAGARVPDDPAWRWGDQFAAGRAFERANADRYQRVFFAGRLVIVALSCLLGGLVWAMARALYGPRAALLALALYALAPEALAHAGLATMDVATALGGFATIAAFWRFARTGRAAWWWATAAGFAFALLTRFTALALPPLLAALAALLHARRGARRPARMWLGLAVLLPVGLVALWLGYLGQASFTPLRAIPFESDRLRALASLVPDLRSPFPDVWLLGLDHQALEGQQGVTPTYLMGALLDHSTTRYFPLAILLKWPIGLLGAIALALAPARRRAGVDAIDEAFAWLPPAAYLVGAMALVHLDVGVRYLLPMLPFACVLGGRLLGAGADERAAPRWRAWAAAACVALTAFDTARVAPYYLTSFSLLAGGSRGHDRLLNDSNVDWGQGLIALRDELRRRGIRRVHLAYHGTTDPAAYGIDYVPYLGGVPGPESDWLAVSSYYFVGLSQRMVTPAGRTPPLYVDLRPYWGRDPVARPAGCMYLFRVR